MDVTIRMESTIKIADLDGKVSRLILVVEIEGKRTEIWIDRFFKERVGRLTNNRICKIVGAMPNFVKVKNMGNYYLVQDSSLEAWLMSAEI